MQHQALFDRFKESDLYGRYITLSHIEPLLAGRNPEIIGRSVESRPLYGVQFGDGGTRILMWSQMHGNESTTTKALFDLMRFLESEDDDAKRFRREFTLYMVPMLNPDGSQMYTRENANKYDLNRDFCDFTQPESKALSDLYDRFKPHYCFNLHDQRTIYGAGESGLPATVSFLSPSFNEQREVNGIRERAMNVIVAINRTLQKYIPGQVGRYDDGFNLNCAGDTFQFRGTPTILFEAGHAPGDYKRETTRMLIFTAYLSALNYLCENDIVESGIEEYLKIPQNKVNFNDFVYKNVKINYEGNEIITNLAAQYSEELSGDELCFVASIVQTDASSFGHFEYDAAGAVFDGIPVIGQPADFSIGKQRFKNGIPDND